jgi:hypothetical protein
MRKVETDLQIGIVHLSREFKATGWKTAGGHVLISHYKAFPHTEYAILVEAGIVL